MQTRRITVTGQVQGVGFRPFVYRLAHQLKLNGRVKNATGVVTILIQGNRKQLDEFETDLIITAPAISKPHLQESIETESESFENFLIEASDSKGEKDIHVPPDYFTCNDCLQEMSDPKQRRYRYPFINCTQCGPRYTIIRSLPYDRPNTSLDNFPLCEDCFIEYSDPADRRFHAQPLACSICGPELEYVENGLSIHGNEKALSACIQTLQQGKIIAVKGVGGYHLMCDALSDKAVKRLRQQKHRPHKPLAVMFPMAGDDLLESVREYCSPNEEEAKQLTDTTRPIVLVGLNQNGKKLSDEIAPGLNEIGAFLPYSPLHHLLLSDLKQPLIATSGNVSGEPVLTDNKMARKKLGDIADAFLHHNRPILRPADDSVIRVINNKPRPIRLGRGKTPLELTLPKTLDTPVIAVGGHMKASVALAWKNRVVISPHISDLGSLRGMEVFSQVIHDLQQLYSVKAERFICDANRAYASHQWAIKQGLPVTPVWHHHAHASGLAGEHPQIKNWLTFTWDGIGLGDDQTLWGGEALLGSPGNWSRMASFRPFNPPGGDKAGREPWRSAAALKWANNENWQPDIEKVELAKQAWHKDINSPQTSAVGRLFDAAACLVLGINKVSFEGQAPMQLEAMVNPDIEDYIELPLNTDEDGLPRTDWSSLLPMLTDEKLSAEDRAAIFHNSMAKCLIEQAKSINEHHEFEAIGLTGGVFQNRVLAEKIMKFATENGFNVYLPQQLPTNDGGLSYGQLIEYQFSKKLFD